MKLKLDENLSRHLKESLAALGHDVVTTADERLSSQPDTAVADAAKKEDRLLLTLDLDFGNILKFPPGSHPGILLFRPVGLGPLAVNRFVEDFVAKQDASALAGCLAIIEPGRVRVRRPEP